jgi:hypothetical protein
MRRAAPARCRWRCDEPVRSIDSDTACRLLGGPQRPLRPMCNSDPDLTSRRSTVGRAGLAQFRFAQGNRYLNYHNPAMPQTSIRALLLALTVGTSALGQGTPAVPSRGPIDGQVFWMLQNMPLESAKTVGPLIKALLDDTATAHMHMAPRRVAPHADSTRAADIVRSMRAALQPYTDVTAAERDGYARFLPWLWLEDQKVYHYNSSPNARAAASGSTRQSLHRSSTRRTSMRRWCSSARCSRRPPPPRQSNSTRASHSALRSGTSSAAADPGGNQRAYAGQHTGGAFAVVDRPLSGHASRVGSG